MTKTNKMPKQAARETNVTVARLKELLTTRKLLFPLQVGDRSIDVLYLTVQKDSFLRELDLMSCNPVIKEIIYDDDSINIYS